MDNTSTGHTWTLHTLLGITASASTLTLRIGVVTFSATQQVLGDVEITTVETASDCAALAAELDPYIGQECELVRDVETGVITVGLDYQWNSIEVVGMPVPQPVTLHTPSDMQIQWTRLASMYASLSEEHDRAVQQHQTFAERIRQFNSHAIMRLEHKIRALEQVHHEKVIIARSQLAVHQMIQNVLDDRV